MEKIALELVSDANDGVVYYADDDLVDHDNLHDDDFSMLLEDEDEPEITLSDEESYAEEEMSTPTEMPVTQEPMSDKVLSFDNFERLLDDEDDSPVEVGESLVVQEPEPALELSEEEPAVESTESDEAPIDDKPKEQNAFDMAAFDGVLSTWNEANKLPGAQVTIIAPVEEPERDTTWEDDGDHAKFMPYFLNCLEKGIPPHSGTTTVGMEKAIAYLRERDKELTRAVQTDKKNVIDEHQAEKLRTTIHNWIERLEDAHSELMGKRKHKKKADFTIGKTVVARMNDTQDIQYFISVTAEDEEKLLPVTLDEPSDEEVQAFMKGHDGKITKEASNLMTFVSPFLRSITRLLIRAHITQGKDLRDVYQQLDAQYKFDSREELSIHELLLQSGLGLNVDLGRLQEKNQTTTDGKNVEYSSEYFA